MQEDIFCLSFYLPRKKLKNCGFCGNFLWVTHRVSFLQYLTFLISLLLNNFSKYKLLKNAKYDMIFQFCGSIAKSFDKIPLFRPFTRYIKRWT